MGLATRGDLADDKNRHILDEFMMKDHGERVEL